VGLWLPADLFEEPKRRSWPGPVTRLERIAEKAGVDPEEYRLWLEAEIQRRLRARGDAWKQLDETLEKRANGH
jgi:hypothetical protein